MAVLHAKKYSQSKGSIFNAKVTMSACLIGVGNKANRTPQKQGAVVFWSKLFVLLPYTGRFRKNISRFYLEVARIYVTLHKSGITHVHIYS